MAPAKRPVYGIKVDVENFVHRLLQDAIDSATVEYWLRRAEDFDTCNPALALNCRRHAWLLADMQDGEISEDVRNALAEVR